MGEVQDFIKLLSRIHIFSDTNWLFLLHNLSSENPMPRGARLDAPGTLRPVMVRGIEGHRIVIDDEDRFFLCHAWGRLLQQQMQASSPGR